MRKSVWLILLVTTLVLSACGPAMVPAAGPAGESGEVFVIALPRIVVDFDAAGTPSVLGLSLNDISAMTGQQFANLQLNKFYIDWMQAANVQHVELRQTGNGLVLLVNGKPLPYLGWSDDSLVKAADVAGYFNVPRTDMIRKFLPIVRRLGLDLVLRFPRPQGVAEIPLADPNMVVNLKPTPSGQGASAVVQFEVKYDQNGAPAILGITPADLASLGINLGAASLAPSIIQMVQSSNIQNIELRSKEDGVSVYVNGQVLPTIVWDNSMLANVNEIYGAMNQKTDRNVQIVQTLLPLINKADMAVLVHFPVAPGQAVIPAKLQ